MSKRIVHDHHRDGIDRRGFLECMAWAGTGVLWSVAGGDVTSRAFGQSGAPDAAGLRFVQISDSHVGFNKAANPDVLGTLRATIDKINALPEVPDFIIHTGDLTHTAKAAEFDALDQALKGARTQKIFFVPGEHDTAVDDGKLYRERYGKETYSFTHKDVHFVGLNNVGALEGMGKLGAKQIAWLKDDLAGQPSSRPVVVFAHVPLWSVYPDWGWATADSAEALRLLKRFGSVTVLNGHIHQVAKKVENEITFYTALSTAFPQPAPGTAAAPGPMKVADEKLRSVLGIREVRSVMGQHPLAVVDSTLEAKS